VPGQHDAGVDADVDVELDWKVLFLIQPRRLRRISIAAFTAGAPPRSPAAPNNAMIASP
jgi:hypothetical protein